LPDVVPESAREPIMVSFAPGVIGPADVMMNPQDGG